MSRELLLLVDALSREKNVQKDIVFAALEMALNSRRSVAGWWCWTNWSKTMNSRSA